ncbi:MAG: hypothetical protein GY937_15105 [bacterium]|nr:hypothetical protein [bacterium]
MAIRIRTHGSSVPTDTFVANNLLFAPDASGRVMLEDGGRNTARCSSCNVIVDDGVPFVQHPATMDWADYSLQENHPLLSAGMAIPASRVDFSASSQFPLGTAPMHVGAFSSSVALTPIPPVPARPMPPLLLSSP